ncbi:hypothetical protein RUND412_003858 [Rhizina undulata]
MSAMSLGHHQREGAPLPDDASAPPFWFSTDPPSGAVSPPPSTALSHILNHDRSDNPSPDPRSSNSYSSSSSHHHPPRPDQALWSSQGSSSGVAVHIAPIQTVEDQPPGPLLPQSARQQASPAANASPAAGALGAEDENTTLLGTAAPSCWNDNPSPVPSFASTSASTATSSSPSAETPQRSGAVLGDKHAFQGVGYKSDDYDIPIDDHGLEEEEEDLSDGGIHVDQFDIDMETATTTTTTTTQLELLYPAGTLPMAIDDDGYGNDDDDAFSPQNLVTRPPSPVATTVSIFELLQSVSSTGNGGNPTGETPGSAMQTDTPIEGTNTVIEPSSLPPFPVFPTESISQSSTPNTLADNSLSESQSASGDNVGSDVAAASAGGDEGLLIDAEWDAHNTWEPSMPFQSPLEQDPPPATAAAANPSPPADNVAAPGIMAVADDGGVVIPGPPSPPPFHAHPPIMPPTAPPPPISYPPIFHPVAETIPAATPFPNVMLPPTTIAPPLWLLNTQEFPPVMIGGGFFDEFEDVTDDTSGYDILPEDFERYNPDFARFCQNLYLRQQMGERYPKISREAMEVKKWARPEVITKADVEEKGLDFQGIPWEKLNIAKEDLRHARCNGYTNYRNVKNAEREVKSNKTKIADGRKFFEFRRTDIRQHIRLIHFQLRNLLGVVSRNDVYYAGEAMIMKTNPVTGRSKVVMDLSLPDSSPANGEHIRISTFGASSGSNGIIVAGGFHGEYAIKSINAPAKSHHLTGLITENENGITNHVQIVKTRSSNVPHAVFSSNDSFVRIMHCGESLKFVGEHGFDWPVNCSATSPDSRLRVVVGDHTDVLVVDAEKGTTEFTLTGHKDFGFAAAWSDDGYTIATGNQDKTVQIYDARYLGSPIKVLPATMAGVRSLKFSPIGNGGKRVLTTAEPADIVHIVDAVTWDSEQVIEFYGEIGGIDFDPCGEELYVANVDRSVGGLMEFTRTKGGAYYEKYKHWEKDGKRERRYIDDVDKDGDDGDEEEVWEYRSGRRGKYYGSGRYKRLGVDLGDVFL